MPFIKLKASHYSNIFWLESLRRSKEEQSRYHIYGIYHYNLSLDLQRLRKAIQAVVNNHYNLRSTFIDERGELFHIIHDTLEANLEIYSVSTDLGYEKVLETSISAPFDLTQGPLFRFTCIQNESNQNITFIPNFHHIVIDGTQFDSLMKSIAYYYHNDPDLQKTDEDKISELRAYLEWESEQIKQADVNYWIKRLKDYPLILNLPYQNKAIDKKNLREISQLYRFEDELYARVKLFSEKTGYSLFDILKTAWALLMSQYSNQDKIIIAYPFNTRNKCYKTVKGAYLNAWLFAFQKKGSFLSSLEEQKKEREFFSQHRFVSILDIIQHLDQSHNSFSVAIAQSDLLINGPVLSTKPSFTFKIAVGSADLFFVYNDNDGCLQYGLMTLEKLFDKSYLNQLHNHFCYLLSSLIQNPGIDLSEHTCLSPYEYDKIIIKWNETDRRYLAKAIHEIFEGQVNKSPNTVALVYKEEKLTYEKLNQKANQLARYIRSQYLGYTKKELIPDTLIPVYLERNENIIISILGIWKAGAAYVPIDPQCPDERLQFMLKDLNAVCILTEHHLVRKIKKLNREMQIILVDEAHSSNKEITNLDQKISANSLAYIMYTSGTTGQPKGVMVEHRSVVNTLESLYEVYQMAEGRRATAFTNYIFDVSVSEFFTPLLRGGELHLLAEEERKDVDKLTRYLNEKSIHVAYLPPFILSLLPKIEFPTLEVVIFAGEPCDEKIGKYWLTKCKLYNFYGPTETTIYATGKQVTERKINEIGKPICNTKAYVLGNILKPLPIGAIGELYIGGQGLARGYLNKPELTAERFIVNPFMTEEDKAKGYTHLYRTQDLVRLLPDGNLEYIGRNDFQIKLRGYRIELGEVEAKILEYPEIKQAVMVVKEREGNKYLIAYYAADKEIDEFILRNFLAQRLSDYMVPTAFVHMKTLPLTSSGKLDRGALPEYRPQKNTFENIKMDQGIGREVRDIWARILDKQEFGADVSFFDLGGNSFNIMVVRKELEDKFHIDISIVKLFQFTTLRQLSTYIASLISRASLNESPFCHSASSVSPQHIINESIALVGMACRIPGAKNIEEFWNLLIHGQSNIQDLTIEELKINQVEEHIIANDSYVKRSAVFEDIFCFDSEFFGYSIKDAEAMDPQQRQFLECVWEALEQSGNVPEKFPGEIGIFAGQGKNFYYSEYILSNPEYLTGINNFQLAIGNEKDFLSTKVSFKLNLTGPSINIQTGCSSSLVAIQMACESLKAKNCDMALAGGVSLFYNRGYLYQEGMIESADGYCRAFDADANGTVAASGLGVVVLKRYQDAIKQKDTIYAVIKGGAINNDGMAKMGYTAPSVEGQIGVITKAITNAGIDPVTISYIEAHGTGTPLGDPIEWTALHKVYEKYVQQQKCCSIGSVKTNIGHTDSAAGVLGCIKTVLSLKNKWIPSTLNFRKLNPEISSFNTLFKVSDGSSFWESNGIIRRAAVSSFGIGGTNAHVILEEYVTKKEDIMNKEESISHFLVPFSAKNRESLFSMANTLSHFIKNQKSSDFQNIAFTAQEGRAEFQERGFFIIEKSSDQEDCIKASYLCDASSSPGPYLIFAFSGKELDWDVRLLKTLCQYSLFRKAYDQCAAIIQKRVGYDIKKVLGLDGQNELLKSSCRLLVEFSIQYALSQWLIGMGVEPTAIMAYGIGMCVALAALNCLALDNVLDIVLAINKKDYGNVLFTKIPQCFAAKLYSYQSCNWIRENEIKGFEYWHKIVTDSQFLDPGVKIKCQESKGSFIIAIGSKVVLDELEQINIIDKGKAMADVLPGTSGYSEINFLKLIGKLWSFGVPIQWKNLRVTDDNLQKISIPTYCFIKKQYVIPKYTSIAVNSAIKQCDITRKINSPEHLLKELWGRVLGVSPHEIVNTAHFLDYGGDSIAALDLIAHIKKSLSIDIESQEIMMNLVFQDMLNLIHSALAV